jgi:hypothetical protein
VQKSRQASSKRQPGATLIRIILLLFLPTLRLATLWLVALRLVALWRDTFGLAALLLATLRCDAFRLATLWRDSFRLDALLLATLLLATLRRDALRLNTLLLDALWLTVLLLTALRLDALPPSVPASAAAPAQAVALGIAAPVKARPLPTVVVPTISPSVPNEELCLHDDVKAAERGAQSLRGATGAAWRRSASGPLAISATTAVSVKPILRIAFSSNLN